MATKKVETKAAAPVKAAVEPAMETSVVEVKKAVPAVKKEVEKAVPAVKKETVKAEPAKKEEKKAAAKPAAKKAPVKKKDPKASIVIEFSGKQVVAKDILDQAKKAFTKANKGVEIKSIEVYVKPEEHVAYYVVNGLGSDDYKVIL